MANNDRRLIPENLQLRLVRLLNPLIKLFTKWKFNPNSFTVAGVVITSMAAVAFYMGRIRLGGILVLLGGVCGAIDGNLARATGKATRFGALFDSAIDRYSEFIMFFGIASYFVMTGDYQTLVGLFLALCGSFMVSYVRARAESLGYELKMGIMQRPERIIFLGLGAAIHLVALKLAIWLVAVFANYTALQRLRHIYKQNLSKFEEEI